VKAKTSKEFLKAILTETQEIATDNSVEITIDSLRERLDRAIVTYAPDNGFDFVITGSHGHEDARQILHGRVTEVVFPGL